MNTGERVRAERRLAAILAADVVGYSRLIGADEEGTLQRIRAIRAEVIDPKIATHHGRLVKTTGDGLLVEFGSVVDALRCATEVQREMARRNSGVVVAQRIEFRIGINVGDVVVENGDIFGDGVNVAARLEGLAEPGGICVSARVQEDVAGRLDLAFEDLGEQSVKNIVRPIRAYAITAEAVAALPTAELPAAPRPFLRTGSHHLYKSIPAVVLAGILIIAGGLWWLWSSPRAPLATATAPTVEKAATPAVLSAAPRLSIVVLPFANLSNDPEQQYFVDGIAEDLTTDLSRIAGSLVISRNTAFTYKDKPINAKQVGRELGVRYVLEGSVQRSAKQVRVNAQLIDAETDAHVWAERLEHEIGDLFGLQNEITGHIAVALNFALVGAEATHRTDNPDALDYVFRARAKFMNPASRDRYAEQVALFERALALDPESADAQGYLAIVLTARVIDSMTDTAPADIARAEKLAEQAFATLPRSYIAHYAKGQVLRAQRRYEDAIPEYETAIALNRNSVSAFHHLAQCKLFTGVIEETIPLQERAIRLSPRDPEISTWYLEIGRVHVLQSRTDDAIMWLEKARNANPVHPSPHAWLAAAYGLKDETEHAAAELAEARRLGGGSRFQSVARMRAVGYWGVPKIRALFEATYFVGLRKAGMPEE
jgi:adenylate cyclase